MRIHACVCRRDRCEAGASAQPPRPPSGWVFADPADASTVTFGTPPSNLTLALETVCRLTPGDDWHSAPQWRWLLFFALWPVLGVLGFVLAWGIGTAVLALEGGVRPLPLPCSSAHPLPSPPTDLDRHE